MERLLPGVDVLLHEQHPAERRRHAPRGFPRGIDAENQRFHRERRPCEARERHADRRRRARRHDRHPVHQDAGPQVLVADQGQAGFIRGQGSGGIRRRAETGRIPAGTAGRREGDLHEDHRRGARARSRAQGAGNDPAQGGARRLGPARQACRLPGEGPRQVRDLPGRGRIRRRLGKTGPRPAHPGRAAAEGQDPERRKGPFRQDAVVAGGRDADQRARHRHRPRRFRRGKSCAITA